MKTTGYSPYNRNWVLYCSSVEELPKNTQVAELTDSESDAGKMIRNVVAYLFIWRGRSASESNWRDVKEMFVTDDCRSVEGLKQSDQIKPITLSNHNMYFMTLSLNSSDHAVSDHQLRPCILWNSRQLYTKCGFRSNFKCSALNSVYVRYIGDG